MSPSTDQDMLPVRMLVQYTFCPRLFYLEWVDGEFRHNVHTIEGKYDHRRTDTETESDEWLGDLHRRRSVQLSSVRERLSGKMDMIETVNGITSPVEIKHGKLPSTGAWFDHRIQLCAYALILRDSGYKVKKGILCYAGSRRRMEIPITAELVDTTRGLVEEAISISLKPSPPPPLQSSRKCEGCSLVPICLPDEYWALKEMEESPVKALDRRIIPARDDALPLYVQKQGAYISKTGQQLKISYGSDEKGVVRLNQTSQVCIMGNVQISTQAVHSCLSKNVPVLYFTLGGYYLGSTRSISVKSSRIRLAQYNATLNTKTSLLFARQIVRAKILNCRTLLMRNSKDLRQTTLTDMKRLSDKSLKAQSIESLLGVEGAAASAYFNNFNKMLKCDENIRFIKRTRRPPEDEINAMLSYAYGMLVKDCSVALDAVGFDVALGLYHAIRPGRPGLSLDLMEVFRPLISDSAVLFAANSGMVKQDDFMVGNKSVGMKEKARKAVIRSYERRMEQLVTHPIFDYRVSYRRILEIEARSIARFITGELDLYTPFMTR